jgi:hypothetical protein
MSNPEIWRRVPSVDGLLASTKGRVMIIPGIGEMPYGGIKHYPGRARIGSWDGSRYIITYRNVTYKVARLVCEAFHGPAPQDKPVCMHLDENSRNNAPTNLAWGTQKENLNAPGFLDYCRSRIGENSPTIKGMKRRVA